jgi:hypothetical protein
LSNFNSTGGGFQGGNFTGTATAKDLHLSNAELQGVQDSLKFQAQLRSMGQSYGITQDLKYGLSKAQIEENKHLQTVSKTAKFTEDGPYSTEDSYPYALQLDMAPESTMRIIRDQIMNENKRNEVQYLRKNYSEGMEAIGDKLMAEVL